ncbi:choline-responsive transcriptional repressor BetI [Thalassovita sp.]|uniref:choline-binding transcriptional repressor BetI n=1 Tax=Thalassovita sp. TaxID=1979401 RepID=UPI002B274091|nr:transcriptional regulator BetI [Thalassovita sp.]
MPKVGMEPIRRAALVKATIAEIGETGTLDVTVSQIAKRAGMSSALAHHYFGGKEQIFLAAMRHTLTLYAAEARGALAMANGPAERVEAIVRASFSPTNFRREVVAAWLNFYVLAQVSDEAQRLLRAYQRRLRSNLRYNLRPLIGDRAEDAAERIAALIDGVYLKHTLGHDQPDRDRAVAKVLGCFRLETAKGAA